MRNFLFFFGFQRCKTSALLSFFKKEEGSISTLGTKIPMVLCAVRLHEMTENSKMMKIGRMTD